jgi:hypothetical protein
MAPPGQKQKTIFLKAFMLQRKPLQLALWKKWKMMSLHAYIGDVESDNYISSNSQSDSSSDGRYSVDDDSSVASYYNITGVPCFWDAFAEGNKR